MGGWDLPIVQRVLSTLLYVLLNRPFHVALLLGPVGVGGWVGGWVGGLSGWKEDK